MLKTMPKRNAGSSGGFLRTGSGLTGVGGIGEIGETHRGGALPELLLHDGDGRGIGEVAGEDDNVGLLALEGGANVVERRDEGGVDAVLLEERVDADSASTCGNASKARKG